jgi:predicted enzyme related to lactoylglutathione lyase
MITHVKFVSIPAIDQDRALKFYTDKLGFRVLTDQPMGGGGQRWIELRIGSAETRFVIFTMDGDTPGNFTGALACDDVDATYQQLKGRGVEFTTPPTKEPWGSYCMMKDSEGNSFVVSSK